MNCQHKKTKWHYTKSKKPVCEYCEECGEVLHYVAKPVEPEPYPVLQPFPVVVPQPYPIYIPKPYPVYPYPWTTGPIWITPTTTTNLPLINGVGSTSNTGYLPSNASTNFSINSTA